MLVLSREDVSDLLTLQDCIAAVEDAFRAHGNGETRAGILGVPLEGGGFHIKAAGAGGFFAVKINGNFFGNPARGLPRIQGLIVLCDATNGTPLAVMDSAYITQLRTAAATAVAAKYLAKPGAESVTIVGCGLQGVMQLEAIRAVRKVRRIFLFDTDRDRAVAMAAPLGSGAVVSGSVAEGARQSDIVVTCTPSRAPILEAHDVGPGTFVAAVGADSEDKQELAPALLARAAVVPDILDQAATIGDLHHAIAAGVMQREDARAELGAIVAGLATGRRNPEEIVIFDSTGSAIQDVAAAALVYGRALRHRAQGTGVWERE